MKYIIGIDPGKEPAICVLNEDGDILGLTKIKKSSDGDINSLEITNFLFQYVPYGDPFSLEPPGESLFVIEDIHSVYGASAKANFQFGRSVGLLEGVCESVSWVYNGKVKFIQPKTWQKMVWEENDIEYNGKKKDTKATSLNAAKRILGDKWGRELFLPTKRSKVINHDMVDAYLIGQAYLKLHKGL